MKSDNTILLFSTFLIYALALIAFIVGVLTSFSVTWINFTWGTLLLTASFLWCVVDLPDVDNDKG